MQTESKAETIFPDFKKFTLANGLEVYFTQNTLKPRIYASILIKVGSKNDPRHATGMAHYLEHLLFKGTSKLCTIDYQKELPYLQKIQKLYSQRKKTQDQQLRAKIDQQINKLTLSSAKYIADNELKSIVSSWGGYPNAGTHYDWTRFQMDLPHNRFEDWAILETERFSDPVFRQFQPELEVVFEEWNRRMENPHSVTWEALTQELFERHPYNTFILGKYNHLKNPDLVQMRIFFDTYYQPQNMAVIISGNLEWEYVKKVTSKYFSRWKPQNKSLSSSHNEPLNKPTHKLLKEKPLTKIKKRTIYFPGSEQVMMGFRLPAKKHKDFETLRVIDMLLHNAEAGLINLNLNQKQKIRSGGSFPSHYVDYGIQLLYGVPNPKQSLDEVKELLLQQLDLIKKGRFTKDLLNAVIWELKRRDMERLEHNDTRANMIRAAVVSGKWDIDYDKVTKKEVIRVAKKYFSKNYVVIYRKDGKSNVPKLSKPSIKPIKEFAKTNSSFYKALQKRTVQPIVPKFIDFKKDFVKQKVQPGLTFYQVNNPINNIAQLTVNFEYGRFNDPMGCILVQLLAKSGTKKLTPDKIRQNIYFKGLSYSLRCYRDYITLSLKGVDENILWGLKFIYAFINKPVISNATVKKHVQALIKSRQESYKKPKVIKKALNDWLKFDSYSSYIFTPTNKELLNLEQNINYPGFISQVLKANKIVYYVGNQDSKYVIEKVQNLLGKEFIKHPEMPPVRYKQVKQTTVYFYNYPSQQALISLIYGSKKQTEQERIFSNLYFQYYGKSTSEFFQVIRNKKSLAYEARNGFHIAYRKQDNDYLTGFVGTQTDKTIEAITTFHNLIKKIPIKTNNFEVAKESFEESLRTQRIFFRKIPRQIENWKKRGFGNVDPRAGWFSQLPNVELKDFKKLLKKFVEDKNYIFTLVADAKRFDLKKLKSMYNVIEVDPQQIFGYERTSSNRKK